MNDVQKLPKIELHVHLDGSVRPEFIAQQLGISREEAAGRMSVPLTCNNLCDYLTCFDLPLREMQTKEALSTVSKQLAEDLLEDGVCYAEIRFAPMKHVRGGLSLEEVIDAVLVGLKEQSLESNLILCLMRDASFDENLKVVNLAASYLNKGVVALDLAGDEAHYDTAQFEVLFLEAKRRSIPFTIHAGEASGWESVMTALSFGAKRIGHGIRSLENKDLLETLKNNRILLEVCPTSNVQTKVVDSYQVHPIRTLYSFGIPVSINTDNRTVSGITLTKEYQFLQQVFHFTKEDFLKMNLDAIEYSFLAPEKKQKLKDFVRNAYSHNKN